ncbi:hypothetical protein ACNVED_04525 [Legionella sp. D16C41]|uniref:hypothetical protein n=1 Tax=Legionella sp. D16C41 TaxID=3402688 RepID=UPI003AF4478D
MYNFRLFEKSAEDAAPILGKLASKWKVSFYMSYGGESESDEINTKLFKELLEIPTDKHLISLPYLVFEASCHIFHELAGDENHQLFDKHTVNMLAPAAVEKAYIDLKLDSKSVTLDEVLVAGIAIWNLMLPESAGGVYPEKDYPKFAENMHRNLTKFWTGYDCEKKITVEIMQQSFEKLKTFALCRMLTELELEKSSVMTRTL